MIDDADRANDRIFSAMILPGSRECVTALGGSGLGQTYFRSSADCPVWPIIVTSLP
jgi:hypothetical protein